MAGARMTYFWEKLRKYDADLYMGDERNARIKCVRKMLSNQTVFEPDILYAAEMSELANGFQISGPVNLLLLGENVKTSEIYRNVRCNILSTAFKIDLSHLIGELQEFIAEYYDWALQLHEALARGKGLEEILNTGYKLIANPIQIIDTSFKLIAGTEDKNVDDPVWTESNKGGYAPYEHISQLKVERFIEKVHKSKVPVIVHPSMHKYALMMSNIIIEDKVLGHLAVLEYDRPFEESDIDLVRLLTEIVAAELQKSKIFRNARGVGFENFITDLLYGKIKDPKVIDDRVKLLGWEIAEEQVLFNITAEQENIDNTPFPNFRNVFESLIPNSKSILFMDSMLMVSNCKKDTPMFKENLLELEIFLKKNQLRCGIGRPFKKLTDLKKCYDQTLKALEYSKKLNNSEVLCYYDDVIIFHLLDAGKGSYTATDLCCPALLDLLEYDRKNRTHYSLTLYTYLNQALSLTEASDKLYIHHNTMRFRIEKIQKLINLDLSNGDILFNLQLSFKILEFYGETGFKSAFG